MELNKQQMKAVNHIDGPCLITACPGSGKTRTIVERTISLIKSGIPQENILCLTFTNKAGREMSNRIKEALGLDKLGFYVGTFHTFCATILRKYGSAIGYTPSYTIFDDDDQETTIKKIIRDMDIDKNSVNVYDVTLAVNHYRENLETEEDLFIRLKEDDISLQIAKRYLEVLKEHNCIDFSGLLYEVVRLFDTDKVLLEKYQEKLKYIQIDEMQDSNFIQMKIVEMIGEKYKNILLVGDGDQELYRFRNARYQNILDFLDNHKDCVNIVLGKNYRSTPEIIKVADNLISHNKNRFMNVFETDNPSGPDVMCQCYEDPQKEASSTAYNIKLLVEDYGYNYSDIMVLYRINSLSMDLQLALSNAQIPFEIVGGPSFFDRSEIKNCLSMLSFCINRDDNLSFSRVAKLFNGVGDATISKIENISSENKMNIVDTCKNIEKFSDKNTIKKAAKKISETFDFDYSQMGAGDCLSYIINKIDYNGLLELNYSKDYQDRIDNVKELVNNATFFGQKNKSIEKYLQNIALVSSGDNNDDENKVRLQTIHSSKGQEREVVMIVQSCEGIIPHALAISECGGDKIKENEAIEGERKCMYVAMTRAKRILYVSYTKTKKIRDNRGFFRTIPQKPSRFLYEAKLLKNK